jgi:hypothetical protein
MSARPDLCGGYCVSGIPTAITLSTLHTQLSCPLDRLCQSSVVPVALVAQWPRGSGSRRSPAFEIYSKSGWWRRGARGMFGPQREFSAARPRPVSRAGRENPAQLPCWPRATNRSSVDLPADFPRPERLSEVCHKQVRLLKNSGGWIVFSGERDGCFNLLLSVGLFSAFSLAQVADLWF